MKLSNPLKKLAEQFPWPEEKPNVPPNPHGWFDEGNKKSLKRILNRDTKIVLELGAWLGKSTRFILDNAPNAAVITVDHWKGDFRTNTTNDPIEIEKLLPVLHETFLVNCWDYKDRLIQITGTTIGGMEKVHELGIEPDIVYIDAAHDYDSVKQDLETAYRLFPKATLAGDDYTAYLDVARAVTDFSLERDFSICLDPSSWILFDSKKVKLTWK